jgi:thiamine biosynthesis protein ThiS
MRSNRMAYLDLRGFGAVLWVRPHRMVITLNGDRYELDEPISVAGLLAKLEIDPRRVAIEHNLEIIKRHTFPEVVIGEGDTLEIVNFVGGG